MHGHDYGLKTKIMLMADHAFVQRLADANCIAMGYGILPKFKSERNVPFACLVCEKPQSMAEAFKHFHDWIKKSKGNSDAVQFSFIRLNDGGYKVCIYQNQDVFLDRALSSWEKDDFEPLIMTASYIKGFDSRGGYDAFLKGTPKFKTILMCYSSKEDEPKFEDGILLTNIKFLEEDLINRNSIESSLIREGDKEKKVSKKRPSYSPKEIDDIKYTSNGTGYQRDR